jgi:ankyrin repeat protein
VRLFFEKMKKGNPDEVF